MPPARLLGAQCQILRPGPILVQIKPRQTPGIRSELVSAHLDPYDVLLPQFLVVRLKIKVDTCGEGKCSSP